MMGKSEKERRIAHIRELAEFVADEHVANGKIDPANILRQEGVRVCFGDFGSSFEGLLEYRDDRFYVYCNSPGVNPNSDPRTRFTLGHETGHYFLDEHRRALRSGRAPRHASWCDFHSTNWVEREADIFSCHLLMPTSQVQKAARKCPRGLRGVRELANQHGTSLTSTALRYIDEHLESAVLIRWKGGEIEWWRPSRSWGFERPRSSVASISELVPGSATEQFINGTTDPNDGVHTGGTTAAFWMKGVPAWHRRNQILIEEVMSLGRYGYLTLLYADFSGPRMW